ncbi:hypothetical protein ACTVCO_11035 [Sanguibacter sp. A247]|uniref:hypothetical protein n=1 Tax=unclassified Sanguibacter TaxID=2645534 RepID=UPI003FD75901
MPDIPEYRFVDADLEPGLEHSPFVAWDVSAHVPHVADPRTLELRRLPRIDDGPERFDAYLSADGSTVVTSHHRWVGVGTGTTTTMRTSLATLERTQIAEITVRPSERLRQCFDAGLNVSASALSWTTKQFNSAGTEVLDSTTTTTLSSASSTGELEPYLKILGHEIILGDEALTAAQLSPDGSRLAISVAPRPPEPGMSFCSTLVIDIETGDTVADIGEYSLHGTRSWSPDGRHLLVRRSMRLSVLEVETGTLTTPPGLPVDVHLQPKKRVHRVQGWHAPGQLVSVIQDGSLNTFFAVDVQMGPMSPLWAVRSPGTTMFHMAAPSS